MAGQQQYKLLSATASACTTQGLATANVWLLHHWMCWHGVAERLCGGVGEHCALGSGHVSHNKSGIPTRVQWIAVNKHVWFCLNCAQPLLEAVCWSGPAMLQ
jgi:hypothetical protein